MKLYAPKYYKKFKCIAHKCEHSCCVGWEIDIDSATLERYKNLKDGYGIVINNSISTDETPHFRLDESERCPHLDEHGLCKIITNLGEDYLCDICRQHPRFYNFTTVAEMGIGMSCPEAARIILGSSDYAETEEVGEVDVAEEVVEFDGRGQRGKIYEILRDTSVDYGARLNNIYSKYSVNSGDDGQWTAILDSLEYLDEAHRDLFKKYSSEKRPQEKDEFLERFLAYFIYRHCTEAFDAEDFRVRLAFCLFCERLFASLICCNGAGSLYEIAALASVISEEIEYSDENTLSLTYNNLL